MNISVVIPTYNRAYLLKRALESVFNQTCLPDEIIVVDDGSSDDTVAVVKSSEQGAPVSIRYFYQKNKGPAAARNLGIISAESTLIAFLDSDDHWTKQKLDIQSRMMNENPSFLISHTREKWYRRGKHLNQKKIHQPQGGSIFERCLQLCCVGMSTVMLRKDAFIQFGYFDEELPCCEDYDYWLRLSASERFLLVDKALTIKDGGRADQVSSIFRIGMDRYRINSIEKLLKKTPLSANQRALACEMLKKKCLIYGNGCLKHGKIEEGNKYLQRVHLANAACNTNEDY